MHVNAQSLFRGKPVSRFKRSGSRVLDLLLLKTETFTKVYGIKNERWPHQRSWGKGTLASVAGAVP